MPQMAPYNWFILFFFFNSVMIFMSTMNYYMYMKKNPKKISPNHLKTFKWKW